MRSVTTAWTNNQAADVADQSCVRGYIETRKIQTPNPDVVTRWNFNNDNSGDNAVSVEILSEFDHTGTTLPMETCKITLENGSFAGETDANYDFNTNANRAALDAPGTTEVEFGYYYSNPPSFDSRLMTRQHLDTPKVSDDDLYATFECSSFASRLGETKFYGGRYVVGGISAFDLLTEILNDAEFPNEGSWYYHLGDTNCKVYAAGTHPLWATSGYVYWTIDAAFANDRVYIPMPIVTHREAILMVVAYVGGYIRFASDGSLVITKSLGDKLSYHLNANQVYDRPEYAKGTEIGTLRGAIYSYTAGTTAQVIQTSQMQGAVGTLQRFIVTHEPCQDTTLTLDGAVLSAIQVKGTYATTFDATPQLPTFGVTVNGKPVTIAENRVSKTYTQSRGEIRDYDNKIASDPTQTLLMFDRYREAASRRTYTFTMRDDPAIETGDRVLLDTVSTPTGLRVIVTKIERSFNGGIESKVRVVTDEPDPWVQSTAVQTNFIGGF